MQKLRAAVDAILVGAGTLRADNPGLLVRDDALIAQRLAAGKPAQPLRVTLTRTPGLPQNLKFWGNESTTLVMTTAAAAQTMEPQLAGRAKVIGLKEGEITAHDVLAALAAQGVRHLLVEGGQQILALFLRAQAVDVLRLAIAPVLVNNPRASRVFGPDAPLSHGLQHFELRSLRQYGATAVLELVPKP